MNQKIKLTLMIAAGAAIIVILAYSIYFFTHGTLLIKSNFQETKIEVDGEAKGSAPLSLNTTSGFHTIKATKDGYSTVTKKVDLRGGETKNVDIEITLTPLTSSDLSKMTSLEKQKYQSLSDELFTQNQNTLVQDNPLVKSLPYIDSSSNFRIDYGGSVFNATYYITVWGGTDKVVSDNKKAALDWIKNNGFDPQKLKIEYTIQKGSDI